MSEHTVTLDDDVYSELQERSGDDQSISSAIRELLDNETKLTHGDGVDEAALTNDERQILEVIRAQMRATRENDLQGYLETMHPGARTQQLKQQITQLWSQYELSQEYTVQDIEVDGDEATVDLLQTTEKISGPEFDDNTILEQNHLVKEDGRWLMVTSETIETKFHD